MQKKFLFAALCCFSVFIVNLASAQGFNPYSAYGEPNPKKSFLRVALNKITLTGSSGFGATFYKQILDDYTIVRSGDRLYLSPNGSSQSYYKWVNDPTPGTIPPGDNPAVNGDSTDIRFRGTAYGIPLLLSLHYQYDRFRIGGGVSFETHKFKSMQSSHTSQIGLYEESFSTVFMKIFGNLGGQVYQYYDYHYFIDVYAGVMKYGSGFNQDLISGGFFLNVGAPIEKEISEYFRLFIRPSYEFKNYDINLPDATRPIKNSHQAFYLNVGFRFNYPDKPRCPIRSCETQMVHVHSGKEFRGRPFYKKQNPKIGENYKHNQLFKKSKKK